MAGMKWKYEIGDRIIDYKEDGSLKRDLTIVDRKIETSQRVRQFPEKRYETNNRKYYKYNCNVCGWDEGWVREDFLYNQKQGCSCCSNKTIVKGINDVATTHPHLVKYFKNKEDAFLYSSHSNHCPELICPNCGTIKTNLRIRALTDRGFRCNLCSDGTSYPEKFICALLKQLDVEYKPQLTNTTYEWCDKYRYDFWFRWNDEEYIIETNGIQHYKENHYWGNVTENDEYKKQLANNNGFNNEHYIVLDCRYSNLNWIKNSILRSTLNVIFDLSKINWNICHEYAIKTIIKDVCEYWEENSSSIISVAKTAEHFKLGKCTVLNYLKLGKELNWCNYDVSEERKKVNKTQEKKVIVLDKTMNIINIFDSSAEVAKQSIKCFGVILKRVTVARACRRKENHYSKGYYFWYLDDYTKEYENSKYQKFLE